jgi:UDP-N-acetylglucosamine 2-epimerase (non-hydrolysing)
MKKPKVMTVLGTRPEIIRLSRVMARLDQAAEHVVVHTGQNYDYELNEIFFEDLGVRKPDHFLGCGGGTLGETLGKILTESERVIEREAPDALLVLGDTNSALAALMARRKHIPIYHMEAGNRCFDRNVPEETNRKIVDHISDFNLAYTEHARRQLLAEGLPHRRVYVTGSPMREVLDHYAPGIGRSDIVDRLGLSKGAYILVSLHREENVDNPEILTGVLNALEMLQREHDVPVVVSTHPRTRKRLEGLDAPANADIRFLAPFGFFDYNRLQQESLCVVSDSGTIAEESTILDFAAVTPRFSIERPEAMDTGGILVSGTSPEGIVTCVRLAIENARTRDDAARRARLPADYTITNTSERVVNLIVGTARLSNAWDGIRSSPAGSPGA